MALLLLLVAAVGTGAYLAGHPGTRQAVDSAPQPGARPPATVSSAPHTASPSAIPLPPTFAQLYQQDSSGVVRVDVTSCSGGRVGSGFLVSPSLVVTAAHVVDGAAIIGLTNAGRTTAGAVVGLDATSDVALVQTSMPVAGHVFTLGTVEPQVGAQIGVIGFPEGGPITFTQGSVSGLDRTLNIDGAARTGLVQTDAALNSGNSGGPMLLADGTVVGLVDAGQTGAAGIGYGVGATTAGPLIAAWTQHPQHMVAPECANPLGPSGDVVQVQADGPDAQSIAAVFATYLNAINGGDYRTAYSQLDSHAQSLTSLDRFSRDDSSSFDFNAQILSITPAGSGSDVVDVDFTSLQNASQGPGGDTCDLWTLAYTVKQENGSWLIDSAVGRNGSTHTACG